MLIFLEEDGIFPSPSPRGLRRMTWGVSKSPHWESRIFPGRSGHTHRWLLLILIHFKYNLWSFGLHKGKTLVREALGCRAGGAARRQPQVGLFAHSMVCKCTKEISSPNQHQHTPGTSHTHPRGTNGSRAVIYPSRLGVYFRKAEIAPRSVCFWSPLQSQLKTPSTHVGPDF